MFFRQYQLACLSHFSYLVGDETTGRAVVVDPQRDVSGYLADAQANGLVIERVIETHFHADFLSGHLELAAATGAVISYGDKAATDFEIEPLAHGQRLSLGEVTLEVRHTPGHTPEAISIVIRQHPDDEPWAVLTGDTLFIGDVGRPDLLSSIGWSAERLAQDLHTSLTTQLLTLPDATLVYPAHGAGSSCGKALSTDTVSTIGTQRRDNHALTPMTDDEFVERLTRGLTTAPPYFAFAADANRRSHDLLDDQQPPAELDLDTVLEARRDGAVIVDARAPETFATGHLAGSINIGIDGRFAEFAGDVLSPDRQVIIVAEAGREFEARVRLARIGFDHVIGYLPHILAVLAAHRDLAAISHRLTAAAVDAWRNDDAELQILDVRNPPETDAGTLPDARLVPLPGLIAALDTLKLDTPTVVYCASGYRSSIATSTLRAYGFTNVADLVGGYGAWADRQARLK